MKNEIKSVEKNEKQSQMVRFSMLQQQKWNLNLVFST